MYRKATASSTCVYELLVVGGPARRLFLRPAIVVVKSPPMARIELSMKVYPANAVGATDESYGGVERWHAVGSKPGFSVIFGYDPMVSTINHYPST